MYNIEEREIDEQEINFLNNQRLLMNKAKAHYEDAIKLTSDGAERAKIQLKFDNQMLKLLNEKADYYQTRKKYDKLEDTLGEIVRLDQRMGQGNYAINRAESSIQTDIRMDKRGTEGAKEFDRKNTIVREANEERNENSLALAEIIKQNNLEIAKLKFNLQANYQQMNDKQIKAQENLIAKKEAMYAKLSENFDKSKKKNKTTVYAPSWQTISGSTAGTLVQAKDYKQISDNYMSALGSILRNKTRQYEKKNEWLTPKMGTREIWKRHLDLKADKKWQKQLESADKIQEESEAKINQIKRLNLKNQKANTPGESQRAKKEKESTINQNTDEEVKILTEKMKKKAYKPIENAQGETIMLFEPTAEQESEFERKLPREAINKLRQLKENDKKVKAKILDDIKKRDAEKAKKDEKMRAEEKERQKDENVGSVLEKDIRKSFEPPIKEGIKESKKMFGIIGSLKSGTKGLFSGRIGITSNASSTKLHPTKPTAKEQNNRFLSGLLKKKTKTQI